MNLSSRQVNGPSDLRELIENSGAHIEITEDRTVDPPTIKYRMVEKNSTHLLAFRHADTPYSLSDVLRILDQLGFVVDYQELK